jgi:hypothetical protein
MHCLIVSLPLSTATIMVIKGLFFVVLEESLRNCYFLVMRDVRLQILLFTRSSFFTKKNGQRVHVDADVAFLYCILFIICNNGSSFESKFFGRGCNAFYFAL